MLHANSLLVLLVDGPRAACSARCMFAHLRTQACIFLQLLMFSLVVAIIPIIGLVSDSWPSMVGVYSHALGNAEDVIH